MSKSRPYITIVLADNARDIEIHAEGKETAARGLANTLRRCAYALDHRIQTTALDPEAPASFTIPIQPSADEQAAVKPEAVDPATLRFSIGVDVPNHQITIGRAGGALTPSLALAFLEPVAWHVQQLVSSGEGGYECDELVIDSNDLPTSEPEPAPGKRDDTPQAKAWTLIQLVGGVLPFVATDEQGSPMHVLAAMSQAGCEDLRKPEIPTSYSIGLYDANGYLLRVADFQKVTDHEATPPDDPRPPQTQDYPNPPSR